MSFVNSGKRIQGDERPRHGGMSGFSTGPSIPVRNGAGAKHDENARRGRGGGSASSGSRPEGIVPLEALIRKNRVIIVDSSVLADSSFDAFVTQGFSLIRQHGYHLLVPQFEFEVIEDAQRDKLQLLYSNGILQSLQYVDTNDYSDLLPRIKHLSLEKGHLCFLANDPKKSWSIVNAAKSAGVFVQVFHISHDGKLVRGPVKKNGPEGGQRNGREQRGRGADDGTTNHPKDCFTIAAVPERMRIMPIPVSRALGKGSVLYDGKGSPITLSEREIVNPDAVTYSTSLPGVWAKVYNPDSVNTFLEEKAKRMLSKKVQYKGLCWPKDIIRDSQGNFVGTLVPPAKGEPLQLAIFKQARLQTCFPDWDKRDLCDLTITILRVIQYLHNMNILMGCINPAAIRVAGKDEVYFVDTDNYQIEGFPSLVYNTSFTPPELQGRKIYLCTKENENYAVATLVFMLMMPGKIPYTIGQDQTVAQAIQERQFPFPFGNVHGSHAMPSMWRFMWSHLTPFKDPFYNTFQKGGRYELPEDRRTVGNWIGTVLRFKEELEYPVDPESRKMYPRTFKRGKGIEFFRCNYCGTEHPRFYFNNRFFDAYKICNGCIDKRSDVSFTCLACGKTLYYTNRTALFHAMKKQADSSWKDQKYCRDCKNKTMRCRDCGEEQPYYYLRNGRCRKCNESYQNSVYKTIACRDCGKTFSVTNGEHDYFLQKGFGLPVRCKSCRARKRNG